MDVYHQVVPQQDHIDNTSATFDNTDYNSILFDMGYNNAKHQELVGFDQNEFYNTRTTPTDTCFPSDLHTGLAPSTSVPNSTPTTPVSSSTASTAVSPPTPSVRKYIAANLLPQFYTPHTSHTSLRRQSEPGTAQMQKSVKSDPDDDELGVEDDDVWGDVQNSDDAPTAFTFDANGIDPIDVKRIRVTLNGLKENAGLMVPSTKCSVARGRRRQKQLSRMSKAEREKESVNKKEKARQSARDCRARKKMYITSLEETVAKLIRREGQLEKIIQKLQHKVTSSNGQ